MKKTTDKVKPTAQPQKPTRQVVVLRELDDELTDVVGGVRTANREQSRSWGWW